MMASDATPEPSAGPSPSSEEVLEARRKVEATGAKFAFEKVLTASDANGSGRLVIPKTLAEAHFPHVESQNGVALHITDTTGKRHTFRFRFWINNQSRMYLMENTQDVQAKFNMGVGDVLVFARHADGKYVVHGRKGAPGDNSRKPASKRAASEGAAGGGSGKKSGAAGGSGGKAGGRPTTGGGREATKKARLAAAAQQAPPSYDYWAGQPMPPRRDGVFRAMQHAGGQEGNKVVAQYGSWSAIVSLGGELFQAFFDSYDSAAAALDAALQAAGVEQVQGAAAAVPSALPASQQQQQALAAETAAPVMKQELVAAA